MVPHSARLRIERRSFLRLPVFAAAAVWLGWKDELLAQEGPAQDALTFDDFCRETGARALRLIEDEKRNEDAYLFEIASLLQRVDRVPDATLGNPYKGIMRTGRNYRGSGIVVVQWSMEGNLTYPAHNHPHYNGITYGIEGDCRIRTFDPVGALPAPGATDGFEVQQTQDQLLTPGRVVSVMSTVHNNIHTLRSGPRGVRGIDVMTLVGKHEGFSFVDIDETAATGSGVFPARWGEHLGR